MNKIKTMGENLAKSMRKPALAASIAQCYHCDHIIDLEADNYIRLDTLESITQNAPKAYAHELCAAEFDQQMAEDRAYEEMMDRYDWSDEEVLA